jgi:hypothetical protein
VLRKVGVPKYEAIEIRENKLIVAATKNLPASPKGSTHSSLRTKINVSHLYFRLKLDRSISTALKIITFIEIAQAGLELHGNLFYVDL